MSNPSPNLGFNYSAKNTRTCCPHEKNLIIDIDLRENAKGAGGGRLWLPAQGEYRQRVNKK